MKGHPGGLEHTRHLVELANFPGKTILDMGAGDGSAVELLEELGFSPHGIDLVPRNSKVMCGNFLEAPYPDDHFDGILSQCSLWISGNVPQALSEAHRLLKPGGVLAFSDVTQNPGELAELLEQRGFSLRHWEDLTPQWRKYYLQWLWNTGEPCVPVTGKVFYILAICRKKEAVISTERRNPHSQRAFPW